MKEKWKDEFHNKLDYYETTPPKGLFEDIISHLPPIKKENEVAITPLTAHKKQPRKAIIWTTAFLSAAAVGMLLLVNNAVFKTANETNTKGVLAKNNNKIKSGTDNAATISVIDAYNGNIEAEEYETRNGSNKLTASLKQVYHTIAATLLPKTSSEEIITAQTEKADNSETIIINKEEKEKEETEHKPIAPESEKTEKPIERRKPQWYEGGSTTTTTQHHRSNAPQMGVLIAGMPNASSNSAFGVFSPTGLDNPETEVVFGQNTIVKKANHHQPITLGISVALPLNNKWSVETGVMYSHHSSDLVYEVGSISHTVHQQLNFVGIPLNLNYQLWQRNKTQIYVSGGGSVEKMVYGKQKEKYDGTAGVTTNKVKMKELQWGLSAHIGTSYNLTEGIGLYLEPGVTYHFKNNSELQTIYSDQPFSFQLKAGVRFNLK